MCRTLNQNPHRDSPTSLKGSLFGMGQTKKWEVELISTEETKLSKEAKATRESGEHSWRKAFMNGG